MVMESYENDITDSNMMTIHFQKDNLPFCYNNYLPDCIYDSPLPVQRNIRESYNKFATVNTIVCNFDPVTYITMCVVSKKHVYFGH